MKKLTLLITTMLFLQLTAVSQPCLPEGITFTTQEEIDNFQINYPNCTEIEGDVEINGDYITNLNGLNVVTAIGGGLKIKNNNTLTSLSGLENLTSINDDLKILGNDALTSLTGLESLSYIGGILEIGIFNWGGNPVLSSLTGLDNLTSIGGYLRISVNHALTSLTGLENVVSIGGYFEIRDNSALTSLSGLDNLTSIGGYLKIWDNNTLTSLTGLENVVSIGGYLEIRDNNALPSLSGLDNLTSIGGYLKIYGNANLLSLFGLGDIEAGSITDLYIQNNLGLSTCHAQSICDFLSSQNGTINISDNAEGCNNTYQVADACGLVFSSCLPEGITFTTQAQIDNFQINYPNCTEIEGDVNIGGLYGGTDITNLNELSVITSIGGKLEIIGNDSLSNLSGLNNLTFIGGHLVFKLNEIMTSLVGLENLTSVEGSLIIGDYFNGSTGLAWGTFLTSFTGLDNLTTIGGNLGIIENLALTNLTGLENVTSIGGELYVDGNASLNSLTGLDNVTSIMGSVGIYNNNVLTSFTGLENLISIEGGLFIGVEYYSSGGGNPSLTCLSGLDNIEAGTINNIAISNNVSLSICEIQSVCDYLAIPGGYTDIHDNAPGCNSQQEVEEACEALSCLPEGITFTTQEDINSFPINYPTCIWIEGDVNINGDDITDLNGLDVVTAIGGNLSIMNNDILSSLAGLENITSIGGNLEIAGNNVLSELTGLENIEAGSIADLSIYYNFELSECDIWNICYYINNTSGTIDIHDNATGCNSQEEVIEACLTSVCEISTENKFIISPNPLGSTTLIQYTLHQSSPVTLKILDLSGQVIVTLVNEFQMRGKQKVDFKGNGLKPGIYFCVLKTNEGIQTIKMIKL